MQVERKSITTAKNAKDYLSKNEVPQLFECLMTGLMYHRPSDHITYLQDCLERIKKQGLNGVRWDMFLDSKKTPLPPIDSTPRENYRPLPLPEIGSSKLLLPVDASVVIIQAGPGIDKKSICNSLIANFHDFVHIETGSILRKRALIEAQNNDSRWKFIKTVIDDGDLVSEEFVIECIIKEMNKHENKSKFIIEGFPRTDKERGDFERFIGFNRLKCMILIDCEEDTCQKLLLKRSPMDGWCDHSQLSINKRIFNYKGNTLAVCKYFDDQNRLRVIDGDKERQQVMKDIIRAFTKEMDQPPCLNPPSPSEKPEPEPEPVAVTSPGREPVTDIIQLLDIVPEEKRNPDLPQCRLVLLLGGPGSGKTEVATIMCSKHPTWVHIDVNKLIRNSVMTSKTSDNGIATCDDIQPFVENWEIKIDALKEILKSVPEETELIILEGFPKNYNQLNQFNTEIGRADFVILLDSDEEAMRNKIAARYCQEHDIEDDEINSDRRMLYFKDNGLPICRHYDEMAKMCIIPGDRDILYVTSDFEKVVVRKLEIIREADEVAAVAAAAAAALEQTSLANQNNDAAFDLFGEQGELAFDDEAEIIEDNVKDLFDSEGEVYGNSDEKIDEEVKENNDERIDEEVNENSDEKIDVEVNENIDEKVDEEVKENSDENVDEEVNENSDEKVDEEVKENSDEKVDEEVKENSDENVDEEVKEKVDEEVKENSDENVDEEVKEKVDEEVNENSDERIDEEVKEKVDEEVNENSDEKVEGEVNTEENVEVVEIEEVGTENKDLEHVEVKNVEEVVEPVIEDSLSKTDPDLLNSHVILLLGGPGSGKKTLGTYLVSKYSMAFIHVDQLVKDAIDLESDETEDFKKYLANEDFDEAAIYALVRRSLMSSLSMSKILAVSGFPRTVGQYLRFSDEVCPVSATIFLEVDEDTLKNRLAARANPELPLEYIDQLEFFNMNIPALLEELSEGDLFKKIDGALSEIEVLEQVSVFLDNFPFMKHDE